jgi:hypothetical protein
MGQKKKERSEEERNAGSSMADRWEIQFGPNCELYVRVRKSSLILLFWCHGPWQVEVSGT